jgi:hypothetical protein
MQLLTTFNDKQRALSRPIIIDLPSIDCLIIVHIRGLAARLLLLPLLQKAQRQIGFDVDVNFPFTTIPSRVSLRRMIADTRYVVPLGPSRDAFAEFHLLTASDALVARFGEAPWPLLGEHIERRLTIYHRYFL